jgi:HAD superfamily hydrolase (TIGR01509 family)
MNKRGIIFDFHGVLASQDAYMVARREALERVAVETGDPRYLDISPEIHKVAYAQARRTQGIVGWVLQQAGIVPQGGNAAEHEATRRVAALQRETHQRITARGVDAMPGAIAFVHWAVENFGSENLAIATTGHRKEVDAYLGRYALPIEAVVTQEDTSGREKPDPLVYELALQQLGLGGEKAIAIDDSPHGLCAARTARIVTRFAMATSYETSVLLAAEPTAVVSSFDEIRDQLLESASTVA